MNVLLEVEVIFPTQEMHDSFYYLNTFVWWSLITESKKSNNPLIKHPEEKFFKVMCFFNNYFYFSSFILFHCYLGVSWPKAKHWSVF